MSRERVRYFERPSAMFRFPLLGLFFALALGAGPVCSVEPGSFEAPDIVSYILMSSEDADGDGDGVNETHIKHYKDTAGDNVFSMTTKGRLWAWSLESSAGSAHANPERNYVIRDSDCDGTFDERYGLDEQFHVPDCLK